MDHDHPFCDNLPSAQLIATMKKSNTGQTAQQVPLVRAAFAEPFRTAMENNGIDADAWFRKVRLPAAKLADPASLVPEIPFWRLINQVAIAEGIPDFGTQVAQAKPWFEIETMKPRLEIQTDLHSLLSEFCDLASGQSSMATFRLEIENDSCRFEFRARPLLHRDIQMELYRVTSMIELVQVFAGDNWRPPGIELIMADNRNTRSNKFLQGCQITFNCPVSAIRFPAKLLDTGSPHRRRHESLTGQTDLLPALEQILSNYIVEAELSIELIADIVGVSPRKLQRQIKDHGSSYRELLNTARKRYALSQLRIGQTGIGEIAKRLGYSNPAHFTRAFNRWTGMTPTAYRLQNHKRSR